MILGFILTALYIPGIAGAATTPRWALLAVALPIILLFPGRARWAALKSFERTGLVGSTRDVTATSFTLVHLFGLGFITWAATSLIWTPNRLDGLGELVKLVILAQAFVLGSRMERLRPVLVGMAAALLISSIVVLIQLTKPDIVLHTTFHSGLFINSGSLAEIAALVLIGLVYDTRNCCLDRTSVWPIRTDGIHNLCFLGHNLCSLGLIFALLPCIILPASRGAWLALITAVIVQIWTKSKLSALALMALAAISLTYSFHLGFHVSSVVQRLGMWSDAIAGLNYLGHGLGSFWTDYAPLSNTLDIFEQRPEHLHNDWLEVLFETGFGSLLLGGGILSAIWIARRQIRLVNKGAASLILAGFFAESLVGFPLHNPCTAFLAALCLGHLARDGTDIRDLFHAGRVRFRAGHERYRLNWSADRGIKAECQGIPSGQAI